MTDGPGSTASLVDILQTIALFAAIVVTVWAAIRQTRAYLGVSFRWIGPRDINEGCEKDAAGRWTTHVFVSNHGSTPAHEVRFKGLCRILPAELEPDALRCTIDAEGKFEAPRISNPGSGLPLYYELRGSAPGRPPLAGERVYAFGHVAYVDIFGWDRSTRFAAYWDEDAIMAAGSGWVAADQHNEAD